MARKQRAKAESGIYHVMLRGINKQNIFLDEGDFAEMIRSMQEIQIERAPNGQEISRDRCTYYAYCILHNHIHILVQEGTLSISELMKRLQDRFVLMYNRRYDRVGHLFQDRFVSEPVDDPTYFYTLLRYIHRNPVKAMEASRPEDYPFSSWREYLVADPCIIRGSDPLMRDPLMRQDGIASLCDTAKGIEYYGYKDLLEWVNMDVDDKCMDMDTFLQPMSEAEAWERLQEISRVDNPEYFKQLRAELQVACIRQLLSEGASLRQASRFTSLSYRALWNRLHPEAYQAGLNERKKSKKQNFASSEGQTP